MEFVAAIGLAASLITCIESTGALLKKLGPSDHSQKDLKRILKTLCGFKGTYDGLKLLLEFNEEDQARLSALQHLKEPLKDCEAAVELLKTRLEGVGFLGKYVTGTFWDRGLTKALKTLGEARNLFETVLNADHDSPLMRFPRRSIVLKAVERYIRNVAEDVRDVQATVNANAKRLLDLEGSSRQSQEETKRLCMDTDAGVRRVDDNISARFQTAKAWCRGVESSVDQVGGSVQAAQRETRGWKKDADQKDKDAHKKAVYQWLSSVDPSTNHNAAKKLREPGTGEWFLEKQEFVTWKIEPDLFIWIHGIPGCGKTVLSSTIIENVTAFCESDPTFVVAYFYFDFNDKGKQLAGDLLSSLIAQLVAQLTELPQSLNTLYLKSQGGRQRPNINDLLMVLKELTMGPHQIYVVIDALDECTEREEVLQMIEHATSWKSGNLHLLSTSRRERDLEEVLQGLVTSCICIQNAAVDADIQRHVSERLTHDLRLRKWPLAVREDIKATLVRGANGMFRWVVCQLDALRKCLTLPSLKERLKFLPKTLNDTYERILLVCIDEEYALDAVKILQYLAYSVRPMRINELAEVLAVDFGPEPHFCAERRLPEPRDILQICSSLVVPVSSAGSGIRGNLIGLDDMDVLDDSDDSDYVESSRSLVGSDYHCSESSEDLEDHSDGPDREGSAISDISDRAGQAREGLRLAHFSVKEYLTSTHIRTGPASDFMLTQCPADAFIAKTCLAYLLQFDGPKSLSSGTLRNFPLTRYAAENWMLHAAAVSEGVDDQLDSLIVRFFDRRSECFANWIRLFDPDTPSEPPEYARKRETIAPRLYYVAQSGLMTAMKPLLDEGVEIDELGGKCGRPLQAAAFSGHEAMVRLLLQNGARVNSSGGYYGTALQAATANGHEEVVKLLLGTGADVDAQGGCHGNALVAAAANGHGALAELLLERGGHIRSHGDLLVAAASSGQVALVEVLLDRGVDVNAQGGEHGNALVTAALNGHEELVRMLLKRGADINALGRRYGTALASAALRGHETVVRLLLDNGVDTNVQGGLYGNALQATILHPPENTTLVELLVEKGADANAQGGSSGNALRAAIQRLTVNEALVRYLLEKGADINAQFEGKFNALMEAVYGGHEAIVSLFLENGADVNAGSGDTALSVAAANGRMTIARLLLDNGADPRGNSLCSPLFEAAAFSGEEDMVRLLLDNGADINVRCGDNGKTPLLRAASLGEWATVMLLLERGADIYAKNNCGDTALILAASSGHDATVRLLVENGVDIEARNDDGDRALHAAAEQGEDTAVRVLLENGADIDAPDESGATALSIAALQGDELVVQTLVEERAGLEIRDTSGRTALHWAAAGGSEAVVRLLIKLGANVKARDSCGETALSLALKNRHWNVKQLLMEEETDMDLDSEKGSRKKAASSETSHWYKAWGTPGEEYGLETSKISVDTTLTQAAADGDEKMVQLLLEKGADIEAKGGSCRRRALHLATIGGHLAVMQVLLDKGADMEATDWFGETALHLASREGYLEIVTCLARSGANVNATNMPGDRWSALSLAAENGHALVASFLARNGADIESKTSLGRTALHLAAKQGHAAVIMVLMGEGVNVEARDNRGKTALRLASRNGHEAVVELLAPKPRVQ